MEGEKGTEPGTCTPLFWCSPRSVAAEGQAVPGSPSQFLSGRARCRPNGLGSIHHLVSNPSSALSFPIGPGREWGRAGRCPLCVLMGGRIMPPPKDVTPNTSQLAETVAA